MAAKHSDMFSGLGGLAGLLSHSLNPVVRVKTASDHSLEVAFDEMDVRAQGSCAGGVCAAVRARALPHT